MKHRKRDPSTGVSSSRSNISRAMPGCIPKIPDFLAIRSQNNEEQTNLASELVLPEQSASSSALQQVEPLRRSPSYYGFDNSSSDAAIAASPKHPRRVGDTENFQPPPASVLETVQSIAIQQPDESDNSPVIGEVSPAAPRVQPLIDQETPTLVRSMTENVLEAENQEMYE